MSDFATLIREPLRIYLVILRLRLDLKMLLRLNNVSSSIRNLVNCLNTYVYIKKNYGVWTNFICQIIVNILSTYLFLSKVFKQNLFKTKLFVECNRKPKFKKLIRKCT